MLPQLYWWLKMGPILFQTTITRRHRCSNWSANMELIWFIPGAAIAMVPLFICLPAWESLLGWMLTVSEDHEWIRDDTTFWWIYYDMMILTWAKNWCSVTKSWRLISLFFAMQPQGPTLPVAIRLLSLEAFGRRKRRLPLLWEEWGNRESFSA